MKDLLTCASGLFPVDRPDWIHGDAAEWQLFQNSREQLHRADMRPFVASRAQAPRGISGHFSILSNRRSHVNR